jgi:hypothetical protein
MAALNNQGVMEIEWRSSMVFMNINGDNQWQKSINEH